MKREDEINRLWGKFSLTFQLVVALVVVLKVIASVIGLNDYSIGIIVPVIELILKLFMVFHVGRYAYLISGKKSYWLVGILGFLWLGIILIAVAYLAVQSIKNSQLKKLKA